MSYVLSYTAQVITVKREDRSEVYVLQFAGTLYERARRLDCQSQSSRGLVHRILTRVQRTSNCVWCGDTRRDALAHTSARRPRTHWCVDLRKQSHTPARMSERAARARARRWTSPTSGRRPR